MSLFPKIICLLLFLSCFSVATWSQSSSSAVLNCLYNEFDLQITISNLSNTEEKIVKLDTDCPYVNPEYHELFIDSATINISVNDSCGQYDGFVKVIISETISGYFKYLDIVMDNIIELDALVLPDGIIRNNEDPVYNPNCERMVYVDVDIHQIDPMYGNYPITFPNSIQIEF